MIEKYFDVFIGTNKNPFKDNDSHIGYQYNFISSLDQNLLLTEVVDNPYILSKQVDTKMLVRQNDIIVKLVGETKFYYVDFNPKQTLITPSFCIIRPKDKSKIFSLDLWAYLNSNEFRKYIKKKLQSNFYTYVLKIADIKGVEIPLTRLNKNKTNLFYQYELLKNLNIKKQILLEQLINIYLEGRK